MSDVNQASECRKTKAWLARERRKEARRAGVSKPVHDYLSKIGTTGGNNGTQEARRAAAAARWARADRGLAGQARAAGLKPNTVRWRLKRGWTLEEALSK